MKKQALMLLALASCTQVCANAEATYFTKATQALTGAVATVQAIAEKNTTLIASSVFAVIAATVAYNFFADGGYENNPGVEWSKQGESEFMKIGYESNGRLTDARETHDPKTPKKIIS